jgi:hypothetical protein
MEGGGGDMEGAYGALYGMLQTYKLPVKPLNIDEYAIFSEQVPAGSAWWISQLERVNAHGLRGNWLSGWQLHDFMGSLVSKPNADNSKYSPTGSGYYPNGDYQVYQYYNLTGVRITTGTWQITINNLSSVGLPTSGSLNIHTWGFTFGGHYAEVDAPNDLGWYSHTYSGNSVTFPVYQTDTSTAYAFEFYVG